MNRKKIRILIIVTVVVGMLFLLDYIFLAPNPSLKEESLHRTLYSQYFSTKPLPASVLDNLNPGNTSQKATAYRIYNSKQYPEAVVQLKYALLEHPKDVDLTFYLGVSSLASGDYEKGLEQFNKLLEIKDNPYLKDCYWYTGLVYLRMHQVDNAISSFQKLEALDPNTEYNVKAILNQINN